MGKNEVEDWRDPIFLGTGHQSHIYIDPFLVSLWVDQGGPIALHFTCGVKMVGDFYLGRRIGTPLTPCPISSHPFKDLLIGLIWFVPFINDTVIWRGNRYLIGKDSVLSPCRVKGIWAWPYRMADAIRARLA